MFNHRNAVLLASGLATLLLFCGCGQKRIESTEVPQQAESNEKAVAEGIPGKAVLAGSGHYLVEKHDCLWTIAGQPRVYGDSFLWPELFKANRDEIKDPDLIYPRQNLLVEKGLSVEEMNHARQMAKATPKYVSHTKARETLPVDYF